VAIIVDLVVVNCGSIGVDVALEKDGISWVEKPISVCLEMVELV